MWKKTTSTLCALLLLCYKDATSFSTSGWNLPSRTPAGLCQSSSSTTGITTETSTPAISFIDTQLRGAAMKLHTTRQSPKEGQVVAATQVQEPYIPTHADYLQFLVDSQHVYEALEYVVHDTSRDAALAPFRNTLLERVVPLETDIRYMCLEYALPKPIVSQSATWYATHLRSLTSTPEFMCHYYNFYFAHTAGGRMIGKQMAALLLDKKTLEFYKWDGDLNDIKAKVKANIELMAATWTEEQKQECVDATAMAFRGGGGINSALNGGKAGH
jgi:heme oxygenase (biliverdin-producing, ferredoxin)